MLAALAAPILALLSASAMAIDLDSLWNFNDPAQSQQRFEQAMEGASPDERLVLLSQIARSQGLRGDFAKARDTLAGIEPELPGASPEVRVRYLLEYGRTLVSAAHPADGPSAADRDAARKAYLEAAQKAEESRLDGLAIDALHMMAFVDTDAAAQLSWNRKALALLEASDQPAARRWEGSLRNNVGYALQQSGDVEGALREFGLSRAAFLRDGRSANVRIADWMIAWTLRGAGRAEEALAIQLRLEQEWDAAGEPDPYVFEELETLYRERGDAERAAHYAARLKASKG